MNYRLKTHAYVEAIQIAASTPLQEIVNFFKEERVSIYKTSSTQLKIISGSQILYPYHSNWIVRAKENGSLSVMEDSTFRAQYEQC